MKRIVFHEASDLVTSWAMSRGYGMGGFAVERTAPGHYTACLELHRSYTDKRPAKKLHPSTGATRERAIRACIAACLRAMADELAPKGGAA